MNFHDYTVALQHSRTDIFSCVKRLYKPQVNIIDKGVSMHELFPIFSHNKKLSYFKVNWSQQDVLTNFVRC